MEHVTELWKAESVIELWTAKNVTASPTHTEGRPCPQIKKIREKKKRKDNRNIDQR